MKSFEALIHSAENQESEKKPSKKLKKSLLAALALYTAPPSDTPQPNLETFDQRSDAEEQLKKGGITDSQRQTYKPGISELLANNVNPYGYSADSTAGKISIINDAERVIQQVMNPAAKGEMTKVLTEEEVAAREDAWRMYLGLPQKNETFGVSDFKPQNSKDDKYYYKINNFVERYSEIKGFSREDALFSIVLSAKVSKEGLRRATPTGARSPALGKFDFLGIMGHFTLTLGEDERGHYVSYYDLWNLEGSIEGENGLIGKPFEIYDRIYYDPKILEFSE